MSVPIWFVFLKKNNSFSKNVFKKEKKTIHNQNLLNLQIESKRLDPFECLIFDHKHQAEKNLKKNIKKHKNVLTKLIKHITNKIIP